MIKAGVAQDKLLPFMLLLLMLLLFVTKKLVYFIRSVLLENLYSSLLVLFPDIFLWNYLNLLLYIAFVMNLLLYSYYLLVSLFLLVFLLHNLIFLLVIYINLNYSSAFHYPLSTILSNFSYQNIINIYFLNYYTILLFRILFLLLHVLSTNSYLILIFMYSPFYYYYPLILSVFYLLHF